MEQMQKTICYLRDGGMKRVLILILKNVPLKELKKPEEPKFFERPPRRTLC